MKSKNPIFLLLSLFLFSACMLGTCLFVSSPPPAPQPMTDAFFRTQWKKEKTELQTRYEKQIADLQIQKDSLQEAYIQKKKSLAQYRSKTTELQHTLRELLQKADSSSVVSDNLLPVAEKYFAEEAAKDSTCTETIRLMEQVAANRDSSLVIQRKSESTLRDLQKEQELRIDHLTEQLNTAYKVQRKQVRENKFLAGGLIVFTGFTTTLLMIQTIQ